MRCSRSITHCTNGFRSSAVSYRLRWAFEATVAATPGAPLWRVQCEVANLVVIKRLLRQVDALDPSVAPAE
jgi:hypothetical protein